MATSVPLQPVCIKSERARIPSSTAKCKACNKGGELIACSFCTASFHNTYACLGDAMLSNASLVASPTFPCACPLCFKKGIAAIQRAVLKPTAQRPPGAKNQRKHKKQKK